VNKTPRLLVGQFIIRMYVRYGSQTIAWKDYSIGTGSKFNCALQAFTE